LKIYEISSRHLGKEVELEGRIENPFPDILLEKPVWRCGRCGRRLDGDSKCRCGGPPRLSLTESKWLDVVRASLVDGSASISLIGPRDLRLKAGSRVRVRGLLIATPEGELILQLREVREEKEEVIGYG
jgi:hypothetical protein